MTHSTRGSSKPAASFPCSRRDLRHQFSGDVDGVAAVCLVSQNQKFNQFHSARFLLRCAQSTWHTVKLCFGMFPSTHGCTWAIFSSLPIPWLEISCSSGIFRFFDGLEQVSYTTHGDAQQDINLNVLDVLSWHVVRESRTRCPLVFRFAVYHLPQMPHSLPPPPIATHTGVTSGC